MHVFTLVKVFLALTIGLCSLATKAAPTGEATGKTAKDMVLDPDGFVHVAEDGIARSYASNGTVIDYAPLSNKQLTNMVNSLPFASDDEKEHLAETFATVNGFAVKDNHQIFHPSTQLRPAVDPAKTHWQKEHVAAEPNDLDTTSENSGNLAFERNHKPLNMPLPCQGKLCDSNDDCAKIGCPSKSWANACFHPEHYFMKTCHDLSFHF